MQIHADALRIQDLVATVLIWKVAPGRSAISACTVALIPMLASAPRMMPHGNQRYFNHEHQNQLYGKVVCKEEKGVCTAHRLRFRDGFTPCRHAHACERSKRVVTEDIYALAIAHSQTPDDSRVSIKKRRDIPDDSSSNYQSAS